MRRLLHAAGLALCLTGAAAGARPIALSGSGVLPHPGVVVLWASWCVPCRAELARLPSLAAAARPLPLALLAIDPPDTARAALKGDGIGAVPAFADGRDPAIVLAAWGAMALPLAVALDARGKVCGRKHGLLGTDDLRAWASRCSQ